MQLLIYMRSVLFFFLTVNTGAAEVLYSTVADLAGVTEKSVVLDVCCGTGTIGLTLAKVRVDLFDNKYWYSKYSARLAKPDRFT